MTKPKLVPLEQWICDTCHEVIEKPEDGWIEWRTNKDGKVWDFRICHHLTHSPLRTKNGEGCYQFGKVSKGDMHLHHFIGTRAIIEMLSWIDVGRVLDPKGTATIMRVTDVRDWADTFRRLLLPYYEEARRCFGAARAGGRFDGENEIAPYTEESLCGIIEEYGEA